jgi:nucleolar pre-ribosomal-associated protein 2
LEKASVPFNDQLIEAAKFIGVHLEVIGRSVKEFRNKAVYHGREEWLLRWILKKLSDEKDATPQQSPDAWWLLGYLIQSVPRNTAARLLVEKKFTEILRATLEGLSKAADEAGQNGEEKPEESKKSSKKRKRTAIEESINANKVNFISVLQAVHAVLSFIATAAESVASQDDGRDIAFTAEYMKSTIRTSAEESAKILGLWLSLLSGQAGSRIMSTWLSPFIELWQSRLIGENDLSLFSLHCTKPLLLLLQDVHWKSELEMLAARNILIPARSDLLANAESQLLSTLTKLFVIQDPATAPMFFDIAIRSIQTHGNGRRKQHDDSWLQHAFNILQEGFVAKRHLLNCAALQSMLLSAIHFKVKLDLPSLRKVTSQYALSEEEPDWSLVAALLKLDGNVFLIPDPSEDLLNKLLSKITKLPFRGGYEWSETISSDVLIPLMHEFAKARDLNGFLHHWHAELVNFEKLRGNIELEFFSPWEGDSLQKELQKIFEPSLTLQQIAQILDWLESEVNNTPDAVSVILQAIAGAVSNEDVVDAVGIRLYRIIRNVQLDRRYRWRSWGILSQSLNWIQKAALEEFELMCKSDAGILSDLQRICKTKFDKERDNLEISEKFRAMCALWNATEPGSTFNTTVEPLLLEFLNVFIEVLDKSIGNILAPTPDVLGERDELRHSPNRGFSWTLSSCVHTLFVEHPAVLM